jgi:hypothetical protein
LRLRFLRVSGLRNCESHGDPQIAHYLRAGRRETQKAPCKTGHSRGRLLGPHPGGRRFEPG